MEIDRLSELTAPGGKVGDRDTGRLATCLAHEPELLQRGEKAFRPQQTAYRVLPAHQRLEGDDAPTVCLDDRLVMHAQLAAFEGHAQGVIEVEIVDHFDVELVGDGTQALQRAKDAPPDLILLCVELPKMSGYSICNKLKKNPSLKDVPLVIMSSEATPDIFEQHRKLKTRAEEYLIKPFDMNELLGKIRPLLDGGAPHIDDPMETNVELDDLDADETSVLGRDRASELIAASQTPEVSDADAIEIDPDELIDEGDYIADDPTRINFSQSDALASADAQATSGEVAKASGAALSLACSISPCRSVGEASKREPGAA